MTMRVLNPLQKKNHLKREKLFRAPAGMWPSWRLMCTGWPPATAGPAEGLSDQGTLVEGPYSSDPSLPGWHLAVKTMPAHP